MNFKALMDSKRVYPILFLGSGISQRYMNSYSWEELIKKSFLELGMKPTDYVAIKNKLRSGLEDESSLLLKIADYIEEDYTDNYLKYDNISKLTEEIAKNVTENEKISRYKELVSHIIKEKSEVISKKEEIKIMKKMNRNIYTYITTNYDNFLEKEISTDRETLIGNNVILKNPISSIYKIHGCVNKSDSLVITKKDYDLYLKRNVLIYSQLINFCIHHPIVFIGFSLEDKNIREILETIFSFVEINSEDYKKLSSNFIMIEYKKECNTTEVKDKMIQLNNSVITIKSVETDNFSSIYKTIATMEIPLAVSELRRIKNLTKEIELVKSNAPKFKIISDLKKQEDNDLIFMLGTSKSIIKKHISSNDFIMEYWEYENDEEERRNIGNYTIGSLQITSQQYVPMHLFKEFADAQKLLEQQKQNLQNNYDRNVEKYDCNFDTILNIIKSSSCSSVGSVIFINVFAGSIKIDELRAFLIDKPVSKNLLSKSDYNKLITLYDYLKYG